jgi:hypothetical protein
MFSDYSIQIQANLQVLWRLILRVHIARYSSSWSHTASPKALEKFVAFLSQIPPRGPFLPVVPVRKYCSVYILRFRLLHGMEEVIGSIPIRSTN